MATLGPIRAKAGHVVDAQLFSDMSLGASWPFGTKPGFVVVALGQFLILLDVHVETFITVLTVAVLVVELTFAHLSQVVLVQIVAVISFLTQPFEPVLAYIVVVGPRVVVSAMVVCAL